MSSHDARKENLKEVAEECKRKKLPSNWESREKKLRYEEEEDQFTQECIKNNLDPERAKNLKQNAQLVDRFEQQKNRKKQLKSQSDGFSTYEAATHKKYLKDVRGIKVDLKEYQEHKEKLGDLAFPTAHTLGLIGQHKDKPEALERLATYMNNEAKKKSYSRRRAFDPDADIDYINERNKRYNELLDRHYGKYTAEIKQNLERGTAL